MDNILKFYLLNFLFTISIICITIIIVKMLDSRKLKKEMVTKAPIISYDEDEIIKHLHRLIIECLENYTLFNITPKNITWIGSKLEEEILNHVQNNIPDRISNTLLNNLSYIYNESYIGKFIGEYIYITVESYILNFNIENGMDQS